jgi:hypothetical protein
MTEQVEGLDGLATFYASHHAVRAEKTLSRSGYRALLVPGPREISPNCGVAMQFEYRYADAVRDLLAQNKVQIEAIHNYRIEVTDEHLNRLRARR